MAWSFRRRIKIAPGVNVNLSKSGVSASIGPKGAKVTVGPKGTYLHTSIPGTGIYNRQKIGLGTGDMLTSSMPMDEGPSKNRGCLRTFLWIQCIGCILLISGLFFNIYVSKNERHALIFQQSEHVASQTNEPGNGNVIQDEPAGIDYSLVAELIGKVGPQHMELNMRYLILFLLIALFILSVYWLIINSSASPKTSATSMSGDSRPSTDDQKTDTINNCTYPDNVSYPVSDNSHPSNYVTEQYFDDLVAAAKRLYEFGNQQASDKDFCKVVDDTVVGSIDLGGRVLINGKDKVPVLLWLDVIRSYRGLGHVLDLSSNEGLGVLIYTIFVLDPELPVEYQCVDMIRKHMAETMRAFISQSIVPIDIFVHELCLKKFDKRLHNQYVVLLYRFTSLIAKADKNITDKEAEWLNKIMELKEPEGIDDAIRPVNPILPSQPEKKASPCRPSYDAADELNALIGLSSVKSEINTLTNYIKVQRMREEKGMKVSPVSLHCVFTGNPGTGKTTVARIVSKIYKELGLLQKGHLVETDRSGLVAEYVGQTAVKTNKIIDSALDGILFIDEAYSLVDGGNSDYGKEAISTLLKRMEDDRERLVVILAGYTDDMKRFIDSNPGLQSRFNRYIEFPDYSADELFQIFESSTKKYEYTLTEAASAELTSILNNAVKNKDKNFGNGRFVRNMFEKVIENQANRISYIPDITAESLATIEAEDIRKTL